MKKITGGITAAKYFKANGIWSGIKRSGKPDLALIISDKPAIGAGVFTKNSVIAAPLIVSKKHLRTSGINAIIINSGNANCFTGEFGLTYAEKTAELVAKELKTKKSSVVVSSTGIIGKPLPFGKIERSISRLVNGLSKGGHLKAAKAILTTDLKRKEVTVTEMIGGKKVTIGGCAKGSGMIAPNMATMLGFITTDVNISPKLLKKALKQANEFSFNRISIDGCMSTNDMVVIMANGAAKNRLISKPGKEYDSFVEALTHVCLQLAKKIVSDGEGATKFIEIHINHAKTAKQAKELGLAVANSVLVKTAAFGSNPNWGRVAAAVGSLGIKDIKEENLKITFSPFKKKDIAIYVDCGIGKESAVIYTSDLSYEYVKINVEYN